LEHLLDMKEQYGLSDDQIAYIGGTLLEAGADTTAAFLLFFIKCIATHPDVQKKAQDEIDVLIGSSRLPLPDDIHKLPYIQAVIQEVARYCPITPTAIPHSTTTDHSINGYHIPAGATVIPNIWGINLNEEFYEDARVFKPERYLQSKSGLRSEPKLLGARFDPFFGFGRRICPGRNLAKDAYNLDFMSLLWGFNFEYPKDPRTGEMISFDLRDVTDGIAIEPKPFKCGIFPRSKTHENIIRSEFSGAQSTFSRFEYEI